MAKGVKQAWRAWFSPEVRHRDDRGVEVAIDPQSVFEKPQESVAANREAGGPTAKSGSKAPIWNLVSKAPLAFAGALALIVGVPAAVLFLVWRIASAIALRAGFSEWVGIPFAIGLILCLAAFWPWTIGKWQRRSAVRQTITAHAAAGLCAGCGYRLSGVEPDSDGCRVCPECGAAWNIDVWRWHYPPMAIRWDECPDGEFSRRVKVADLRGRLFPLMLRRSRDELRQEVERRVDRGRRKTSAAIWATIAGLLLIIVPFSLHKTAAWMSIVITSAFFLVIAWVTSKTEGRGAASQVLADELIRGGTCPSCEWRLAETAAPDGARVCQNCGGAWRA